MRFFAEYLLLRVLAAAASVIPRRRVPAAGAVLGRLGYRLVGRRRRIALRNLRTAFPEKTESEIEDIARGAFSHFGRVLIEGLRFPLIKENRVRDYAHYTGLENIRKAYERGKGVFLFSAHFGNWELVALLQGYLDMPLDMIVRKLDNPRLETWLEKHRTRSGNRIIYKEDSARKMIRAVRNGRGIAILIDQRFRGAGSLTVDFFGEPAETTPSLAALALRTGAAVVPVFSFPRRDGSYDIVCLEEVDFTPSGDRDRDIKELTELCTGIIEENIRGKPECWLWMHDRFGFKK